MKATERRKAIVAYLSKAGKPISGSELSERFAVSRQIIVGDVAMLKGTGYEILSTHQGYLLQRSPLFERVFKVRHTSAETEDELTRIIELGGTVVDVFVWHKVYGRLEAPLNIFSKLHIRQFIEGVRSGKSTELIIPASINGSPVVAIADNAFENSSLVSVSIPETLKSIGWFAFSGCSKLERIIIPKNVTEIGYSAFSNASKLVIYAPKDSYAYQYAKSYGISLSEE